MCTGLVGTGRFDELCVLDDAADEDDDGPFEVGPFPVPVLVDEQAARTTPAIAHNETSMPRRMSRGVDVTGPG
jgi:hypothetical protein